MNKPFQIRLFCKGQSFKSQFAARLLTFYGRRHEADQGSDLTEDDIIEKLENSDFKDLPLKFLIEDFEFEIIWQNDKMIEKENNNTIFILLLELEKSLQVIQSLQNYEMTQDCFLIIIDTISKKKKEENIKNFEKQVLQKINENLPVYISEANISSILLDIKSQEKQENKKIICNRLIEAAKSFGIPESKSQRKQKLLEKSLIKIIQKYQINDFQQFIKDIKLGDIQSGVYHIDDRRTRKKLQEELQSLEILNQFLQQKLKSKSEEEQQQQQEQEQEQEQEKEKENNSQIKKQVIEEIHNSIVPQCHSEMKNAFNFIFNGKIQKILVSKNMTAKSLLCCIINHFKQKGISFESKNISLFAIFENSKSIELVDQTLHNLELVHASKIKSVQIQVKVEILVFYEIQIFSFLLKSYESIHDLKICIEEKIKIPIDSQGLLYQSQEKQKEEEIFYGTFHQIKSNCFSFIFILRSKMSLHYFGFNQNYEIKIEDFTKFYIEKQNDIRDMISYCNYKQYEEKRFFSQLIRFIFSALKRKFPFSLVTDQIRTTIIDKNNQQIWSKQNFTNYFILYYLLYNSQEKLRIELISVLRTHYPLPLYFRSFNKIKDVKNEWKLNNQIQWLIHKGTVVTSVGLHTQNSMKENGKTYLNNELFYTSFQKKEQKHPISFGCPQITLKSLGHVVPVNIIDIPSDCPIQIRDRILSVSNVVLIHSWVSEKDTQEFIQKLQKEMKINYIVPILRDCKNSSQTISKVRNIKFQQKQILSINNLEVYVLNNKGIPFQKILKQKVWEVIDKAHKNENENKNKLHKLFENQIFNDFDKICQKLNKSFYDLGRVTTQYVFFKQKFKNLEYSNSQYEKCKNQIVKKGLHPDFEKIILFINANKNYLNVLMLRFKQVLKQIKNQEEKKRYKINFFKQKINETEIENFKPLMNKAIEEINKFLNMSKLVPKDIPDAFVQELSKKIEWFQNQIKPKFFTIELAWRQLQHLTMLDPSVSIKGQPLIDILINLKRKQVECHQPFEFLDGDLLEMPKNILKQSFLGYREKVVVVTIFGPQSSGKSTLLNFLFGCDFGTSEARCTKGVYGTFFRFANSQSPCEGIFLVDTEGLFGNFRKKDAQKRKNFDSKLVLFCLGISDIVIINTKGNLDTQSEKMVLSSWERLIAFTQQSTDLPELYLVLNQNTSGNIAINRVGINKLQQILNLSNSFVFDQAYHLYQISHKDVQILPEFETFVKKQPRQEFLVLTNKLQKSIMSKVNKKDSFKQISNVIDLMQKMWNTIEAFPDLGRRISKKLQYFTNKIKEWKFLEMQKLNQQKDDLIKKLKQFEITPNMCNKQFEKSILNSSETFRKTFLSQSSLDECDQEERVKLQLEGATMKLCFQAFKFQMKQKINDFEKDKQVEKYKTQGSESLFEEIRKIKQIQIIQQRSLSDELKNKYFNDAFNKSLDKIKLLSSPEKKLENYFEQIYEYYENALQTNQSKFKQINSDFLELPKCEWKRQINNTYSEFSQQIISQISLKSQKSSNKILEYQATPPTVVLDEQARTDAKLNYFNMRNYFCKKKIKHNYYINEYYLRSSLKKDIIKQQISETLANKKSYDYKLEEIFHKVNQFLKYYYSLKILYFDDFKKSFDYQNKIFQFHSFQPQLQLVRQSSVQNVPKGQHHNTKLKVSKSNQKNFVDSNQKESFDQINIEKSKEETKMRELKKQINFFFNFQSFQQKYEQYKNQKNKITPLSYYQSNLKSCIYWKKIQNYLQNENNFVQTISDINKYYQESLNSELQPFGLQIQCKDFYQYIFNSYNFEKLSLRRISNKKCFKNEGEFLTALKKLDKFDSGQILTNLKVTQQTDQKTEQYSYQNNSFKDQYLYLGYFEGEELEVSPKFKNNRFLQTYISGDNKRIFYDLKTDTLKNFLYSELEQKKSFDLLFENINKIIQNSQTILTRNNIVGIYVDVSNQIKEFNNDLNQVSHKLTLVFTGYIHLYAVYLIWKRFSDQAIKEANKPYKDLEATREKQRQYFLLETSNDTIKQSQCGDSNNKFIPNLIQNKF